MLEPCLLFNIIASAEYTKLRTRDNHIIIIITIIITRRTTTKAATTARPEIIKIKITMINSAYFFARTLCTFPTTRTLCFSRLYCHRRHRLPGHVHARDREPRQEVVAVRLGLRRRVGRLHLHSRRRHIASARPGE